MKKIKLLFCISVLTVATSMGAGLTACNESSSDNNNNENPPIVTPKPDDSDKDKPVTPPIEDTTEFDEAVKKVDSFIAKMNTSQNFTQSIKLANGEPTVIKFNREVCEVTADNVTIFYSPMQDGKLYKIAKDSEDKWRKSECESAPYTVSDIVTVLENSEWESYDNFKLTGKTVSNEQNAAISVKLSSGTFEYTLSYSGNNTTGTIYNVESTTVTLPEIEDEKPEEPSIDYDNLTAADLTAEQKATIANNVTTALATNLKKNIGRTGIIDKIIGVDFSENKVRLLLEYTNSLGKTIALYEFALTSNISLKTLLTNEITPANTDSGTRIISFEYTNNNEKTDAVFNKLYQDRVIYDRDEGKELVYTGEFDLQDLQERGVGYVGFSCVDVYGLNEKQLVYIHMQIRSDGATRDYITDNMINGKLIEYDPDKYEKGYFIGNWAGLSQVYTFTENALYDFNGLEKQNNNEQEN